MKLRPFVPGDLPAVAALHARVYPQASWCSQAARASYFREVLLHNPWQDPQMPSWIAEESGRVIGFFGVLPRRMLFRERPIRVAVGCQFMVDPGKRRSLAALELIRRYFSGPQDLSVADGANEMSRRLWEAAGGITSPLHGLHWLRPLRPARALLQRASSRRAFRALAALGVPLTWLADACVRRLSTRAPEDGLQETELDARALLGAMNAERGAFALRPDYELGALEWLLAQVEAKKRHGELQSCLVRDAQGRPAGWFLYYLNRSISPVVQLGARRGLLRPVLSRLYRHALERGAVALEGRMEPRLTSVLDGTSCRLLSRGIHVLVHARDPQLLLAFLRGEAFFSRLEGEWWMRFAGEESPAGAERPEATVEHPGAVAPAR
jgi:hypothetical protein